jgi:hypothetical protein
MPIKVGKSTLNPAFGWFRPVLLPVDDCQVKKTGFRDLIITQLQLAFGFPVLGHFHFTN